MYREIVSHLPRQKWEPQKLTNMIKKRKVISVFTILFIGIGLMFCGGCTQEPVQPRSTTYNLKVKNVLGVAGTATFTETSPSVATITITLTNAPAGIHPAQLCMNSVVEGGNVQLNLNPVDETGVSKTEVTTMTYTQLIAFNGFIKVLQSSSDNVTILVQGDIGGNVLTSTGKFYDLTTIGAYGVAGTALFQQRQNGNTLVTISLTGTIDGNSYPATINLGSIASVGGGPVVALLSDVDGTTGRSFTNVKTLTSGIAVTFDNWLVYDGYINIYQAPIASGVIICHGNIGSN